MMLHFLNQKFIKQTPPPLELKGIHQKKFVTLNLATKLLKYSNIQLFLIEQIVVPSS